MVKLRLKRMGRKFGAFYRIVAIDALAKRDGKYIEEIGFYNPHSKETRINLDLWKKWIDNGAQPTQTVANLFKKFNSDTALKVGELESGEIKKVKPKKKKVKVKEPVAAEEVTTEEPEVVEGDPTPEEVSTDNTTEESKTEEVTKEEAAEEVKEEPQEESSEE